MAGRASYRRSQERAQDVKDWISEQNPSMDWDEYNAKFDALSYFWPIVGDFRKAYDEYSDLQQYLDYHGMQWKDLKPGRVAAQLPHVGSSMMMLSKNLMRLYR